MSREIDMNNLSEADILYLQERGKRPAGVQPVGVSAPSTTPISELTNTGDVGLAGDQTEGVFTGAVVAPRFQIEDNYDELNVSDLKDEIDVRNLAIEESNEGLDEEEQVADISKKGRKEELIARLRADDQRVAALEADAEEEG